jgi:hypothetical protein
VAMKSNPKKPRSKHVVVVPLTEDMWTELCAMAALELRSPTSQAAFYVRDGLQRDKKKVNLKR